MKHLLAAMVAAVPLAGATLWAGVDIAQAAAPSGKAIYDANCAQCHDRGEPAPAIGVLRGLSADRIHQILATGVMKPMASGLTDEERWSVARYLGTATTAPSTDAGLATCPATDRAFNYAAPPASNGFGIVGVTNTRRSPDEVARLSPADASRLRPIWSAPARRPTFPLIAGGSTFTTTADGKVLAFASETGCLRWSYDIDGAIRAGLVMDEWKGRGPRPDNEAPRLYFGDRKGAIYAVNAATGALVWKREGVHENPFANLLATPALKDGRLYVSFSSSEGDNGPNADPKVSCCTFRGMLAALDARDGSVIWRHYTIPQAARPTKLNNIGVQQFGPSGGAALATATIDTKRGLIYSVADNNYSDPRDENSNSVYALDLKTGRLVWHRKTTPGNPHNAACAVRGTNCPSVYDEANRSDWGFKAAPVLVAVPGGPEVLVAAQKSGQVWGLNPGTGAILWETRTTSHKVNFGTLQGVAVSGRYVYATVGEFLRKAADGPFPGSEELGLYKLDAADGRIVWMAPTSADCPIATCGGYLDAPLVTGGMVVALSYDQFLRVYDEATGKVLKRVDLNLDQGARVKTSGGGPSVAHGVIYAGTDRRLVAVSAR
jgi:polyvinyl alcohol dehydrogenase (cytochrome)